MQPMQNRQNLHYKGKQKKKQENSKIGETHTIKENREEKRRKYNKIKTPQGGKNKQR
jgi:hypothetical protein